MFYFDGIILVEGKNDVSFLSSFIDSEYVVTNGYEIPSNLIDYLANIKKRKIVVLVDPDNAGRNIENKIRNMLPNALYFNVNISACNKHGKHGVAECEKDEILRVLKPILSVEDSKITTLSRKDYLDLELMVSYEKRAHICAKLHLGTCNSKTLFKRLNYNSYTKKDIEQLWK